MHRRLTWGLASLRVTGCAALLLLLWNPISSRLLPGTAPPLVLLDASLSMAGRGGRWREALDSARALSQGRGGVIWRFGAQVAAFDSSAPTDGASRLGPALAAAAARGGPVTVVTDGEVDDITALAPDLLQRIHIAVLPRAEFRDAFVAAVEGARRIGANDTLRLKVTYGVMGTGDGGRGMGEAKGTGESKGTGDEGRGKGRVALVISAEGRRLASREVSLPDSGIVSTEITLPPSPVPRPGWHVLDVRLVGAPDSEPRDDGRIFLVDVNPTPSVVLLASPPDWDLRFFARTLADVAQVPVTVFVETEPGRPPGRWRDAKTLEPVSQAAVQRALAGARLVVEGGDPARFGRMAVPAGRARLLWPTGGGLSGEWYVDAPPPSPFAAGLAGLAWDSLPPAVGVMPLSPDSSAVVALSARLARRGQPRPVVLLSERGSARRAELAAVGLYRWAFRGGASAEAYRALVAEIADWLLGGDGGRGRGERVTPKSLVVANGMPVVWRWTGAGPPRDLGVTLTSSAGERRDTLRFDAAGEAALLLPPAVYTYVLEGGSERGRFAVETYSDEWRPHAPVLAPQPGAPAERVEARSMRDRWWLFVLAIAAFTAEWAWRRRVGLA